jgi:2-deoxy-D-gluconate 3-dehydrogenase
VCWWSGETGNWQTITEPEGFERNAMFVDEMNHFLDVVQGKARPICSLTDGVRVLEIALCVKRAAKRGQQWHSIEIETGMGLAILKRKESIFKKFDLTGRVVIITGAAGLLGTEYRYALAGSGANVVLADINGAGAASLAQRVKEGTGVEAMAVETDVPKPLSVQSMASAVVERFGRVDALVNNAALDPKFDPSHAEEHTNRFETFPFKAWQRASDVNITGMFLCAQAVSKPMLEAGRGVIVNISSTYGLVGPDQRLYQREGQSSQYKPVTYTVSKAASVGLTRYLSTCFAGTGIQVNTLTPGGVFAGHDDEFVQRYSAKKALRCMAEPDEMSAAPLFLFSDALSYMTGVNLIVDGGWTAW